jgi:C1A family cysteine protease
LKSLYLLSDNVQLQNRMKKHILLGYILLIFLLCGFANAVVVSQTADELHAAPINPEFIRYMNEKTHGSQEQVGTHGLGLVPSPIYRPEVNDVQMFGSPTGDRFTSYQAKYDLRTLGKVSPVKDQNPWGTCWAFATFASLESTSMPATPTPGYSEKNLANLAGFDYAIPDGGGHMWMSSAYLTRWNGPVNSATDPYPSGTWTSSSTYPPVKHVQNVVFFPGRTSRTDNDNIKGALTRWGAVYSSLYWNARSFYNETYTSYYWPASDTSSGGGHAVTIVGWDDNYAATNFTTAADGPGAWIVKNSWGSVWGSNGYFYISYYDKSFGSVIQTDGTNKDTAVFLGESTSNYDTVYSYDKLGEVNDYYGATVKTGSFANVFTANSTETIKAVGFYTTDLNVPYTISIYKNPTSGPVGGTPAATFSGTLAYMGYNTVEIPSIQQVPVTTGDRFSVVVQVTNPTNSYYIPIERNRAGYTSGIVSQSGQGYSLESSGWTDWKTIVDNSHICVKAYTSSTTTPPIVTGILPATGSTNGGTQITITGSGFTGATAVHFGTTAATGVTVVSATSITATSPAHTAGIVDVTVTTPSGTSATSAADRFTYVSAATNGSVINQYATIFIGEDGLNVADALNAAQGLPIGSTPTNTVIGWWASATMIPFTSPTKSIDLVNRYQSMEVAPADFVGFTGNWYLVNPTTGRGGNQVFTVADPSLSMAVWDFLPASDVTGGSVLRGEPLGFQIHTNMYAAVDGRYRSNPIANGGTFPNAATDGYITIKVKNPNSVTYSALQVGAPGTSGTSTSLLKQFVSTQPWYFGTSATNAWITNATDGNNQYLYPVGTYSTWAESTLNNMKENYKNGGADYTGKTVSETGTVTIVSSPTPATSTVGIFRTGNFFLASSNMNGGGTVNAFNFGQAGDIQTAGDWSGSGLTTVGIFRSGNFFLASNNIPGGGTVNAFNFGMDGDVPVAGKWSGSGAATVGIFRSGNFFLASSNTPGGGTVNAFNFGQAGDVPVAGDWSGSGSTTVGIFRSGNFFLASSNIPGGGTVNAFNFGQAGDVPVTGDWNGDGKTEVGVFRSGVVYLASNNIPGGGTVTAFTYGMAGDEPVAGKWI